MYQSWPPAAAIAAVVRGTLAWPTMLPWLLSKRIVSGLDPQTATTYGLGVAVGLTLGATEEPAAVPAERGEAVTGALHPAARIAAKTSGA